MHEKISWAGGHREFFGGCRCGHSPVGCLGREEGAPSGWPSSSEPAPGRHGASWVGVTSRTWGQEKCCWIKGKTIPQTLPKGKKKYRKESGQVRAELLEMMAAIGGAHYDFPHVNPGASRLLSTPYSYNYVPIWRFPFPFPVILLFGKQERKSKMQNLLFPETTYQKKEQPKKWCLFSFYHHGVMLYAQSVAH